MIDPKIISEDYDADSSERRIYNYPLELKSNQTIECPPMSPLYVGTQNDKIMLWGLVTVNKPNITYHIRIIGTGEQLNLVDEHGRYETLRYIGTVMPIPFVWHVFQVLKDPVLTEL